MRKIKVAAVLLAALLSLCACTKAQETQETKETVTETAGETKAAKETAAPETEEEEEAYFYGFVTEVSGSLIRVKGMEGRVVEFDISGAPIDGAVTVGVDDEVEVAYRGELEGEVNALSVEVILSAAGEEASSVSAVSDDLIRGTVEEIDDEAIRVATQEGVFTLRAFFAQRVTQSGIDEGTWVEVTYYGDLEDEDESAVATRIVSEDAFGTKEAAVYKLSGIVGGIYEGTVTVETEDPDNAFFDFAGEEGLFDGVSVGDEVTVTYLGSLTQRVITAIDVE